jgi:NADPH:quinone reductase-like Zn-dependent oxidoreductase
LSGIMAKPLRAAIHSEYGDPATVLRVVEVPAEEPGPDEVVVRMEAAAMHIADLRTIQGVPPFALALPRTPGFEGVGRVVRVGSAVQSPRVGERVFPALGSGTFRDEVRCAAQACLPAPDGDALQLSLLTVNGATAAVLLEDFGALGRGDWLIQNAANSSCGRYLIRLAREAGVRSVNVVRRQALVGEIQALGADVVLVDGPDLAARVAAATGGAPIKVGIDAVGGPATQRIAECLAPSATVVSYGSMTGTPCQLDFYLMFRSDIRLVGLSFVRQFQAKRTPEQIRALYARLADLMARGILVAKIAGVYPLASIGEACARAALTGTERDGKVIIRLNDAAR